MIGKLISIIVLTAFPFLAESQIKLSGVIVDKVSQQAVEYVNIGLVAEGIGTVSSSKGEFELTIPYDLASSSLFISHIGYETATLKIAELKSNSTALRIELIPQKTTLQEVVIKASQSVTLGHKPNDDRVKGFFKAAGLGLEAGSLIKNSGPVELTQFNLNILNIPFDSLKFRLNIYSVKKLAPASKLNTRDIIFTLTRADTGHFSLPLTNQSIGVTDNFICSIELIELFGQSAENAEFLFSAVPDRKGLIYKKEISLAKWEKLRKYSLCFWLTGKK